MKKLEDFVFERGISNITKSEYERIILSWLLSENKIEGISIDNGISAITAKEIVKIANALQITPAKVSSLLKNIYYSNLISVEEKKSAVDIICNHIKLERTCYKDERLELLIKNPVEHEILKNYLAENDAKYDSSFNNDLLKISFETMEYAFSKEDKRKIVDCINSILEESEKKELRVDAETSVEKFAEFMRGMKDTIISISTTVIAAAAKQEILGQ